MKQYECTICGYIYDEAKGDPEHGKAARGLDMSIMRRRKIRFHRKSKVTSSQLKSDVPSTSMQPVSFPYLAYWLHGSWGAPQQTSSSNADRHRFRIFCHDACLFLPQKRRTSLCMLSRMQ